MKKTLLALTIIFSSFSLLAQPIITQNPQDADVCVDSCASYTVEANGNGLTYLWYMADTNGSNSFVSVGKVLTLCDSLMQYNGSSFYCVVKDVNDDSVTSASALLTVDSCLAPIADFSWQWDWEAKEVCFNNTSMYAETVIWLFGDGSTDASNTDSLCRTYEEYELYFVKLQVFNDYGMDEITKPIDFLGVDEVESALSVFPNPMQSFVQITFDQPIGMVEVVDISGRSVIQQSTNRSSMRLDVDHLTSGVYTLRIAQGEDIIQRRLIKP